MACLTSASIARSDVVYLQTTSCIAAMKKVTDDMRLAVKYVLLGC